MAISGAVLSTIVTEEIANNAASGLVSLIKGSFPQKKLGELKFVIEKGLPHYLRATSYKCERIKTLLNRNDPVLLSDSFVEPNFVFDKVSISTDDLFKRVRSGQHAVIVCGLAGSGKSAFLKYAFTRVIESGDTYYPVFFELRNLNGSELSKSILRSAIVDSIRDSCEKFSKDILDFGLKRGAFYFLLDGFDELDDSIRDAVGQEIEHLAATYQDCSFILTSRPSRDFYGWTTFKYINLQPFSLDQAIEYIRKMPYDEEQKNSFISDLSESLYEENSTFLSNPLLTAMMLFTYSNYGEIPTRRHVFYEKCFDVLAREHDSLKGRYQRKLFSGVSLEELEKIFMFFCVLTYRERKFRFTNSSMKRFVEEACRASVIRANPELVIRDLQESISIVQIDGQEFEFIHRSFQEYFYAKFVVDDRNIDLETKISWLVEKSYHDDVVAMVLDMDDAYFEESYLIPELNRLSKSLSGVDPKDNPAAVFSKFYRSIGTRNPDPDAIGISMTVRVGLNYYLLELSRSEKYSKFLDVDVADLWPMSQYHDEMFQKIKEEHDGEIKYHHMNNKKLIDIGITPFAEAHKRLISEFLDLLEVRRNDRQDAMSSAFAAHYLGKKP